jgi:hypothetical protein
MTSIAFGAETKTIDEVVLNAVKNHQTTVDISSFKLTPEQAIDAYISLRDTEPLMWATDKSVNAQANGSKAKSLVITYDYKADEVAEMQKLVDSTVDGIVAKAEKLGTDYDKARFVYDYLIDNYNYDKTLEKLSEYELFTTKSGVCSAYSIAYKDILTRLNIPCEIVVSDAIQHEWNIVKIDGEWYNVDAAWADDSNDRESQFLKSDVFMSIIGHTGGVSESGAKCTSTIYDINY